MLAKEKIGKKKKVRKLESSSIAFRTPSQVFSFQMTMLKLHVHPSFSQICQGDFLNPFSTLYVSSSISLSEIETYCWSLQPEIPPGIRVKTSPLSLQRVCRGTSGALSHTAGQGTWGWGGRDEWNRLPGEPRDWGKKIGTNKIRKT